MAEPRKKKSPAPLRCKVVEGEEGVAEGKRHTASGAMVVTVGRRWQIDDDN
jgi:hypothetical protein